MKYVKTRTISGMIPVIHTHWYTNKNIIKNKTKFKTKHMYRTVYIKKTDSALRGGGEEIRKVSNKY